MVTVSREHVSVTLWNRDAITQQKGTAYTLQPAVNLLFIHKKETGETMHV